MSLRRWKIEPPKLDDLKPKRKHRLERSSQPELTVEDDHLWAISYADLLMVVLSFFVIFFSQSQENENIIQQIISVNKDKRSGTGGEGRGQLTSSQDRSPNAFARAAQERNEKKELKNTLSLIASKVESLNVVSIQQTDSVVFQFPNNIYRSSSYVLNSENKERLDTILNDLKPFIEKIDIIFVGHSDKSPVKYKSDIPVFIENNFDLSSMRANYALRYALSKGMPPKRLFTYGAAENKRDSRSLSLLIRPRGELL